MRKWNPMIFLRLGTTCLDLPSPSTLLNPPSLRIYSITLSQYLSGLFACLTGFVRLKAGRHISQSRLSLPVHATEKQCGLQYTAFMSWPQIDASMVRNGVWCHSDIVTVTCDCDCEVVCDGVTVWLCVPGRRQIGRPAVQNLSSVRLFS